MGCLKPDIPERVQAFIDAISQMMQSSLQVMVGEELHRRLNTRFWRRHEAAWDAIFDIGKYKRHLWECASEKLSKRFLDMFYILRPEMVCMYWLILSYTIKWGTLENRIPG